MIDTLETDVTIIRERRILTTGQIVLVITLVLVAGITGYWYYYINLPQAQDVLIEENLQAEFNKIYEVTKDTPAEFILVPEALTKISLPEPDIQLDSLDIDAFVEFQDISGKAEKAETVDYASDLPFREITFNEYINNSPDNMTFYQLRDELAALTIHFNQKYPRQNLGVRAGLSQQVLFADSSTVGSKDVVTVYPPIRAVDAYMVANILSRLAPEGATLYNQKSDEFVKRGIQYGLYGTNDALAAKSLTDQYFKLLADNPAVINLFSPLTTELQ